MATHPTKDELSGFLLGKLAPQATEEVAEHIDHCPPCQETVHSLEGHQDTLLESLRQPTPPSVKADADVERVVEKVAGLIKQPDVDATHVSAVSAQPTEPSQVSIPSQPNIAIPRREQFLNTLLASGLVNAVEWMKLQAEVPAITNAADGAALARALMQHGTLTKFQASVLYQGKSKGLVFGEYAVLDRLGAGGMGQVFKAQHRSMDRIVALKVLSKAAMKSPDAIKRFQREVKAAAKLFHPNIVTAFDAGQQEGVHFLVMEYVEGSDLSAFLKAQGPLPVEKAVSYILQTARGLAFAHSKGVVHRDIKPANLLLDGDVVKILDMGLARIDGGVLQAAQEGLTQTGQVMGTVDYMAPEQAFDTRHADAKADMYSLGCTLYRLLTGQNLYTGETLVQKILAHREKPIPSLRDALPDIPPAVDALYQRMVAKEPQDRPTMAEAVAELEGIQRSLTSSPQTNTLGGSTAPTAAVPQFVIETQPSVLRSRPSKPVVERQGPPWRNRRTLVAAGAAGFILLLLGVWVIVRDKDGKEVGRMQLPEGGNVSLEPDSGAATKKPAKSPFARVDKPAGSPIPPPAATPSVTPLPDDYALFAHSVTTDVPLDLSQPLTLEAYVTPSAEGDTTHWSLMGYFTINLQCGKTWSLVVYSEDQKQNVRAVSSILPVAGRRTHVAGVYTPQALQLYVDGILTATANLDGFPRATKASTFQIGANIDDQLDEVRVSKSVRYDKKFTPQARFATDADTLALYHCDEGTGDVLHDASGHGRDGKIFGAKWVRADSSAITNTDFAPLFNGRDLTGWKVHPDDAGKWRVENGILKGSGPTPSHLFSERANYEDFHLRVETRVSAGTSAGITCREPTGIPSAKNHARALGYLAKINADSTADSRRTGSLYVMRPETHDEGNGVGSTPAQAGDWFTMDVVAEGFRIRIAVNGQTATDYVDENHRYARGAIAPQFFAGSGTVEFRKIEIRELKASRSATPPAGAMLTDTNSPAFQAWMKQTAALPADKQVDAVKQKLMELNPGFDGTVTPKFDKNVITELRFFSDEVTDISPLRALSGLKVLNCYGSAIGKGKLSDLSPLQGLKLTSLNCSFSKVSDLSPLRGMPLTYLYCGISPLSDLSPLQGMPLEDLNCSSSAVSDLSPLAGMPLKHLDCYGTRVSDLSPLGGMPLTSLSCATGRVFDLSPLKGMSLTEIGFSPQAVLHGMDTLRGMKSLKMFGFFAGKEGRLYLPPEEFWKRYDAGEFRKPVTDVNDPAFQKWVADTQKLPAEKQIEAVSKKLIELNPGFDGQMTGYLGPTGIPGTGLPKVDKAVVTEVGFVCDNVTDLSPVRGFPGLKALRCTGGPTLKGKLSDLSPLAGMPLTKLEISANLGLSDLAPLRGMKLTHFGCIYTAITDWAPLQGMSLVNLNTDRPISDLSFLKGMPLEFLGVNGSFSDLSPLRGMPLRHLGCSRSQVTDLSPLKDMPLSILNCDNTPVGDLSPLKECKDLKTLTVTKTKVTAEQVASLQKALPKCKITWDDPAKGAQSKPWDTPEFQKWVADTQKLPAEKQLEAVSKKLMELNPGFDGNLLGLEVRGYRVGPPKIENGVVTELGFFDVVDISPVRALSALKRLNCGARDGSQREVVRDLSPLAGMSLTSLDVHGTSVSDLTPLAGMPLGRLAVQLSQVVDISPLRGMPLTDFNCSNTKVTDLSPLRGAKLTALRCNTTPISDLSPLAGMPLKELYCQSTPLSRLSPLADMPLEVLWIGRTSVTDLAPLHTCKSLKALKISHGQGTPAQVAALQKALPNCKIEWDDAAAPAHAWDNPEFQQWVANTQKLPADKQLEAVSKKLMELNAGFDGKLTDGAGNGSPRVADGIITELGLNLDAVTDLAPLRALAGLKTLSCKGSAVGKGKLSDLSPLRGLQLTSFTCNYTRVADLSPLQGMPLTYFYSMYTAVSDLSPLQGMPLVSLNTDRAISDLSFLKGMPLELLWIHGSFSDLSPLRDMPLRHLSCRLSQVTDLSPLKGMPLSILSMDNSPLSDLSPLAECKNLKTVTVRKTKVTADQVAALQKALPNCKIEWDDPAKAEATTPWETPEFQKWVADTQKLPADKQIEAVSKKLMELNPGFDGKLTGVEQAPAPKITGGVVTDVGFNSLQVMDLSPVRALTGLKRLDCSSKGAFSKSLSDLSPLRGLKLSYLCCQTTSVSDLSVLEGMPLTTLRCGITSISDLSPLRGAPLTLLASSATQISDLAPLAGMQLDQLSCSHLVSDLAPLAGMPLTSLIIDGKSKVTDLSPLESCRRLKSLKILSPTKITAEQIAALQKVLPNCKIEWDDSAKPPP